MKHPIQPVEIDQHGTLRFKKNAIVEYLLDNGGIDLNTIAMQDFSDDDRRQFAQLIGYSVSGFGSLSYADDETYTAAHKMHNEGLTAEQARLQFLEERFSELKTALREPIAALFEMHPEDLGRE